MNARRPFPIVALCLIAVFSLTAFGLYSAMFNELGYEMAARAGLSMDELDRVKTGFTISQVWGFILIPLTLRRVGTDSILMAALGLGLCSSIALALGVEHYALFTAIWLLNGLVVSTLLVVVNLYLLDKLANKWLPAVISGTLIFSTLLPMGAYPWLIAQVLESFDLSAFYVALAWLFFCSLTIGLAFPHGRISIKPQEKSSLWFYSAMLITSALVIYLLMRGSYYNWLDSDFFVNLTLIAASLTLLTVFLLMKLTRQPTASMQLHRQLKANVFMYNAFLAGFAVIASTALFNSALKMVLQYNALNSGFAQLPAFYGMLIGMALSVLVYYVRRPLSDAIVPVGVLMILISVYLFSQLPSNVGPESLLIPMLLRGFGVGLLNVSVTIAVLLYFHRDERIEGISNFYLFRTLGGLVGGAYFSRVMQTHSAQASGEVGTTLNGASTNFAHYEQLLNQVLLTQGHLPNSSLGMSQISSVVKLQATTLGLSNALLVFILSIFALAPVLIIGKKLVAKQAIDAQLKG
ncbi:MFS transporter [Vibrio renipiscarius]|uniref:MFS transporter n=1 Tax=Vibrio renipiscarius TaxID=1461322 RepID=UPI00354CE12D